MNRRTRCIIELMLSGYKKERRREKNIFMTFVANSYTNGPSKINAECTLV